MRFSLKDILWTVALACLGLNCFFAERLFEYVSGDWAQHLVAVLYFLSLPLLGAAVGRPFHMALKGVLFGLLVWCVIIFTHYLRYGFVL